MTGPENPGEGILRGCPGTGPRTGTGDGQVDARMLPFEQEKGPH
jgi:hypothetical protein